MENRTQDTTYMQSIYSTTELYSQGDLKGLILAYMNPQMDWNHIPMAWNDLQSIFVYDLCLAV